MFESSVFNQTIPGWSNPSRERTEYTIGVLPGEGIGPEIIAVSLRVLEALAELTFIDFRILEGGKIGLPAKRETGCSLTPGVIDFCGSIFAEKGAILCGPGGARFVYELRSQFDLFCKLSPLRPVKALLDCGVVKADVLKDVDILMVRENAGGVYFGRWEEKEGVNGLTASHCFEYRADEVERILHVAIGLARKRRGRLSLVLKSDGIPSISQLWIRIFNDLTRNSDLSCQILEVDNATFRLIGEPSDFDVIVSPNLFGDILADCGGLLLSSRGMCFSGNFGTNGKAVYQTGHGAAYGLAGRDKANPIGQVFSLSMLLRTSFGLHGLADLIEGAVGRTLTDGWRTADILGPNSKLVGTRELGELIVQRIEQMSYHKEP